MKKTELILILLIAVGILMKVFHLPGSGMLLTLSLSTMALFYWFALFPLSYNESLKEAYEKHLKVNKKYVRFGGTFFTSYIFSMVILGILFKIQLWKSADILLTIGLIASVIILVISAVKFLKKKEDYYLNIFKRVLSWGLVGFILFNIPSLDLVKFYHRNASPEYIKAYEEYLEHPDSMELYDKLQNEREKMHSEDSLEEVTEI